MSARRLRMLQYLADGGEVPLHVLLAAFWPKAEPEKAMKAREQWVRTAVADGHVAMSVPRGENTTVRLTPKAAAVFATRVPAGAVSHPRARGHHAATLQFIEQVKAGLATNERVVEVLLEPEIRARVQAGRGTRRGERFDSFPDAAVVIERTNPDGSKTSTRVAVEYVTSKYTSKDIIEKAESFAAAYDRTLWVADKARTSQRVRELVGAECPCLT